jgi:hypothetical protein
MKENILMLENFFSGRTMKFEKNPTLQGVLGIRYMGILGILMMLFDFLLA